MTKRKSCQWGKLVFSNDVYLLAETRMHDCNFHIPKEILCLLYLQTLPVCLSVSDKLFFIYAQGTFIFVRCICISLESNTQEWSPPFPSLCASLPSNDTVYHSKVFSNSLPSFKEMDLKDLEQVKNVDWILTWAAIQRNILGEIIPQRVPGTATQTTAKATHGDNLCVFTGKYLFSVKGILLVFSLLPIHFLNHQCSG